MIRRIPQNSVKATLHIRRQIPRRVEVILHEPFEHLKAAVVFKQTHTSRGWILALTLSIVSVNSPRRDKLTNNLLSWIYTLGADTTAILASAVPLSSNCLARNVAVSSLNCRRPEGNGVSSLTAWQQHSSALQGVKGIPRQQTHPKLARMPVLLEISYRQRLLLGLLTSSGPQPLQPTCVFRLLDVEVFEQCQGVRGKHTAALCQGGSLGGKYR